MSALTDRETAPAATGSTVGGLSRRAAEFAVAGFLLVLFGLAAWDSWERGAGWDGTPQSGFFPARIGVIGLIATVAIFVNAFRQPRGEVFVTWDQLRRVVRVAVPLLAYIALIGPLGIYLASGLFIILFMLVVGRLRWWAVITAAIMVPAILFWVFEIRFLVPLPKGPLEALFGY